MKKGFFIFLCILFPLTSLTAQSLKGRITNQAGEPVSYATVYIEELRQGTTANSKGNYEIKLPAGQYKIVFQSLGFQPMQISVTISDVSIIRDIVLPMQYYQIPEVRISATGEDPAYGIMRKAIGIAPYYLNNISYYKANVYLKGNLLINKIPKLIKMTMEKDAKKSSVSGETMKVGETYLMESYNEIEFTAPDKYVQKVLSYKSTFPEEGNEISPMQYISASFYQPVIADLAISPLSPNAFSYYNFKYLGATTQGNFTINKIQVIPKRKSQQVFDGIIYIIEDLWCLQSVDLNNENIAGNIRVQQLFIPVQNEIWMPVSEKFDVNISIMGFKADAGYAVSVKYDDVRPNLTLQKPSGIILRNPAQLTPGPTAADTVKSKNRKQIEKILSKDELNNRDMARLAKMMKKETEKSVPDSIKNNLEIKENTTHIVEKDAGSKDSSYWAAIRPIPLSDREIKSLRLNDSINRVNSLQVNKADSVKTPAESQKKKPGKFVSALDDIGFGHTWSGKKGLSFRYGGLIDAKNLTFNTVDGFAYGLDFRLTRSWKDKSFLGIYPDVRWAFSRQALNWKLNANYRFAGSSPREIYLRSGMSSKDIGSGGGINPFLNSITSLFFELNYLKLYESDYVTLGFKNQITNGFTAELTGSYEYRKVLANSTSFSFVNTSRVYTENVPVNRYLGTGTNPVNSLTDQNHGSITARLTYVPRQKYRMDNGTKIPAGSDWPTFIVSLEHGFNQATAPQSTLHQYNMLKAEAFQKRDIGAFSEFRWRLRTGGFLDNRNISFFDFFHFNPQPVPLLLGSYEDSFMIPSYYTLSTPEFFGEAHAKYTTPYLLLKLLPGLSNTLMRENLWFSFLSTRHQPVYTEIGYTLSEIFLLAEAGVFVGFDGYRYRSTGIKVILRFD